MEDMKTFECALCGKNHKTIQERIKCETECLKEHEALQKKLNEDAKKKEKIELESKINKELEALINKYDEVSRMIQNYYKKFGDEDIYDKIVNRYIPRTFFDFIF